MHNRSRQPLRGYRPRAVSSRKTAGFALLLALLLSVAQVLTAGHVHLDYGRQVHGDHDHRLETPVWAQVHGDHDHHHDGAHHYHPVHPQDHHAEHEHLDDCWLLHHGAQAQPATALALPSVPALPHQNTTALPPSRQLYPHTLLTPQPRGPPARVI